MNSLDYILFIPLLYGFYRGFTKGLIIELASLLALTLGIYGALHFSSFTFEFLSHYVEIKTVYLQLASYGLTSNDLEPGQINWDRLHLALNTVVGRMTGHDLRPIVERILNVSYCFNSSISTK